MEAKFQYRGTEKLWDIGSDNVLRHKIDSKNVSVIKCM